MIHNGLHTFGDAKKATNWLCLRKTGSSSFSKMRRKFDADAETLSTGAGAIGRMGAAPNIGRKRLGGICCNGDDTVSNTATGLMWQQADNGAGSTWRNALSTCEALELAGQTDWRLPDIRELQSIVDDRKSFPAVPSAFSANEENYWSATTDAQFSGDAWYVYFGSGFAGNGSKENPYRVRCVRGGPAGPFYLDLTKPNGGEILVKGQAYTITWNSRNITGTIQIDLYRGPVSAPQFFRTIAAAARNSGRYQFTRPSTSQTAATI